MLQLELELPPAFAASLTRVPALRPLFVGGRRARTALSIVWHDSEAGDLAAAGETLAERRQGRSHGFRLERIRPAENACSPGGTPEAVLATALTADALGARVPERVVAVVGFEGTLRNLGVADPAIEAQVMDGVLRAANFSRPTSRLLLSGPAASVTALAQRLAAALPVAVAARSLAAEAYAMARPNDAAGAVPRRLGPPQLPPGLSVGGSCQFVCAHLADVIQHHARLVRLGELEPVHQMRVAMRRLRSALTLFRRALECPELEAVRSGLQALGQVLGPARDWDVFCTGTGRLAAATFPSDPAVQRMAAAAQRRRAACYRALHEYLTGAEFRSLGIAMSALAAAPPWEGAEPIPAASPEGEVDPDAPGPQTKLRLYAAQALTRRLNRMLRSTDDIAALPDPALHDLRLQAKRLRYAAEIAAPLYPRRDASRFIRRVTVLQERLGLLNDGAVAAGLMGELGAAGGRGFAAGVVSGLVAARAAGSRERIARSWRRLQRADPFW